MCSCVIVCSLMALNCRLQVVQVKSHDSDDEKLKESNDQELVQSEPNSRPKNLNGRQPKLQTINGHNKGKIWLSNE